MKSYKWETHGVYPITTLAFIPSSKGDVCSSSYDMFDQFSLSQEGKVLSSVLSMIHEGLKKSISIKVVLVRRAMRHGMTVNKQ